jgi:hypothetical protein
MRSVDLHFGHDFEFRMVLPASVMGSQECTPTGGQLLIPAFDDSLSIRKAAILHALLDVGAPDFRGLASWYAFVHLLAARGAGVVPFLGMIADQPGAAGQRRQW